MKLTEENVVIHAFHESGTDKMLDKLKDMIDITKCYICDVQIVRFERKPYYIMERIKSFLFGNKYYDWNIGAITQDGIVCDEMSCFATMLRMQRDEEIHNMIIEVDKQVRELYANEEDKQIEYIR